jgi:hypothetical protein
MIEHSGGVWSTYSPAQGTSLSPVKKLDPLAIRCRESETTLRAKTEGNLTITNIKKVRAIVNKGGHWGAVTLSSEANGHLISTYPDISVMVQRLAYLAFNQRAPRRPGFDSP